MVILTEIFLWKFGHITRLALIFFLYQQQDNCQNIYNLDQLEELYISKTVCTDGSTIYLYRNRKWKR